MDKIEWILVLMCLVCIGTFVIGIPIDIYFHNQEIQTMKEYFTSQCKQMDYDGMTTYKQIVYDGDLYNVECYSITWDRQLEVKSFAMRWKR